MSDRRKVFELFDKYNEWTESKVNSGIELYRKGLAEIKVTDSEGKTVFHQIASDKYHSERYNNRHCNKKLLQMQNPFI